MISIREISDDKSSISSTRWAFASVVKVDTIIIVVTWLVGLVSNIIPQIPTLPNTFYGHVALLLGILTGIITTSKALQGFEPHSKSDFEVMTEKKKEKEL